MKQLHWKRLVRVGCAYLVLSCLTHYLVIPEASPPSHLFPRKGARVVNESAGETIVFLKDRFTDDPTVVKIEVELRPGGSVPTAHVHGHMNEIFTGVAGKTSLKVSTSTHVLIANRSANVPAGAPHLPANPSDDLGRFTVTMKPVGVFDLCLLSIHGYLGEMDPDRNWLTEQMQLARFAQFCDVYRADIPIWMQRSGLFLLNPTLRALGFRRWL